MKTAKNYILASLPTISRFSINLPSCAPLHRASLPLLRAPAPAVVCLQGGGAEQCRAAALARKKLAQGSSFLFGQEIGQVDLLHLDFLQKGFCIF